MVTFSESYMPESVSAGEGDKKASPKATAKAKAQAVHGSCMPLQTQKTTETYKDIYIYIYQAYKILQDMTWPRNV